MASIGDVTRPAFAYDQATDTWVPVGIGPHSHTAAGVGAVATSSFAAKGDLLVGTGAGTLVAQTVGANGTVLTADSTQADGVIWAAPASGGKVLQVVNAFDTASPSTTSGTLADAGLTATITPTSATSKVLVIVNQYFARASNASAVGIQLLRGSTSILQAEAQMMNVYTTVEADCMFAANILDAPATTSATTYKTQFRSTGGGTIYANGYSFSSTITLLEIGA